MGPALARIAVFARPLVMSVVTNAVIFLAASWLLPKLNDIIATIAIKFGVDEETARDIAANEFLIFAESVGVTAVTLKARLPAQLADKLGFTTKGFSKRTLKPAVAQKVALAKGDAAGLAAARIEIIDAATADIATKSRLSFSTVKTVLAIIGGFVGSTSLALLAVAQWIDFGNWNSGAYQGTFNKLYAKFGLVPDKNAAQPRVASQEMFEKVYQTMKDAGITQIRHPDTGEVLPFTAQNAAAVIDKLASKLFISDGKVPAASLLALALALTDYQRTGGTLGVGTGSAAAPVSQATTISLPKVFTGVVSQGTLGSATSFTPRPDDLITSTSDLQVAAANNLAPFLASLASRLVYEIKIVTSITTANGFTQRGTTQQVQSGTYADGRPKYKSVTNKFAVLNLFVLTKTGGRSAVATIVLGPTDAAAFHPAPSELDDVQKYLATNLQTSDINDIATVRTATPDTLAISGGTIETTPTPTTPTEATKGPTTQPTNALLAPPDGMFYAADDSDQRDIYYSPVANGPFLQFSLENFAREIYGGARYDDGVRLGGPYNFRAGGTQMGRDALRSIGIILPTIPTKNFVDRGALQREGLGRAGTLDEFKQLLAGGTPSVTSVAAPTGAAAAQTLFDYYTALGRPLPTLADRATLYQSLGLGPASFYTGTAEQNTKLLSALKAQGAK